eukprot:TRINITY_DN16166_c0_g1_i4.p1 TRINITY_DN16166_c0_g1~~TRINITY_DN16166_c0_g1_i4.p1  ORF type:complete len:371 (+),score=71.87 TRINITY_DN16166_c0_g1_i4:23-1135(+)
MLSMQGCTPHSQSSQGSSCFLPVSLLASSCLGSQSQQSHARLTELLTWQPLKYQQSSSAQQSLRCSWWLQKGSAVVLSASAISQRSSRGQARHSQVRRLAAATSTERELQVLPLIEPSTGSEVVLVACMHFNPRSVNKATAVTKTLADRGALGAVVIESCPTRWERVEEVQGQGSLMRSLLDNEMQAAAEVAEAAGEPVVLGDQRIEELADEISAVGKQALEDLASPFEGGWQRTGSELMAGFLRLGDAGKRRLQDKATGSEQEKPPWSPAEESIGLLDFLDLELMIGTPIAYLRYILSTLMKAPQLLAIIVAIAGFFAVLPENIFSDLLNFFFGVILARIFLAAILRDRDTVLARSVRRACEKTSHRTF